MAELFEPTIQDQIACLDREVRMRRSVYPRFVANGKMSQAKADREIATMECAISTLLKVKEEQDAS